MKRIILAALLGVLVSGSVWAANETPDHSRFVIANGTFLISSGSGELPEVTLLLDKITGQTWFLVSPPGKSLQWQGLPFHNVVPQPALPPKPARP